MEIVLSIAGSDPSAGAGIQQDLKTITAMGCYGATVITALTSQNTLGVQDVMAVPCNVVNTQLHSIFDDLKVSAVKIGQIPDSDVAKAIVKSLRDYLSNHFIPVVYDPVMISTSGRMLMKEDSIKYIADNLFPLCTLVTPNIPETEVLACRKDILCNLDIIGHELAERFSTAFLVKGGHFTGESMTDRLYMCDGRKFEFHSPRIESSNLHGTGCTLSSAIASALALGNSLPESVDIGKQIVTRGIQQGKNLKIGSGNGPLWI